MKPLERCRLRASQRCRILSQTLLGLPPPLLTVSLAGERLFRAPFVARLEIKGVLLDVLDDVFLLHLALETPQRALDRLTFLKFHLGHRHSPPFDSMS